jgi:hypothetical protein
MIVPEASDLIVTVPFKRRTRFFDARNANSGIGLAWRSSLALAAMSRFKGLNFSVAIEENGVEDTTRVLSKNLKPDMINSAYAAFAAVEVINETSFYPGSVCAGSFECDGQQCRREDGRRRDKFSSLLLQSLSSALPLAGGA